MKKPHMVHQVMARRLLFVVWVFAVALGGCANATRPTPGAAWDARVAPDPRLVPRDAEAASEPAREDWARAEAAFDDGRWALSQELFDRFSALYPLDPLALRAQLLALRAQLNAGDVAGVDARLRTLDAQQLTPDARAHVRAYLAFMARAQDNPEGARRVLEQTDQEFPGLHLVPGIAWEEDLPWLAALWADTRIRTRSFDAALLDLEVVYGYAQDPSLQRWALASASSIAREALGDDALDALVRGPSSFQRAVAVGPLVERRLSAGDTESATAAFQTAGLVMLAHDMSDEYAALQNTLALSGSMVTPMLGVALSLTGDERRAARAALGSILLAQQAFDEKGRISDLLIEDTGGYEQGTISAVQRLCARGVPVIIGPVEARLAPAAQQAAAQCGAVYLGLESVAQGEVPWTRISLQAEEEARALAALGRDHGALRWVLVSETPQAEYFESVARAMNAEAQRIGARVIDHVRVDIQDVQASSQRIAQQLRRVNADAIVFAVSSPTMMTVASYLAAAGVWPRTGGASSPLWLATSMAWGNDVATNSARYVEGMFLSSWLAKDRPQAEIFLTRFQEIFGREPGVLEAFAFDAATLARQAVLDLGVRDGATLRRRLDAGFVLDGVTGQWTWQRGGLAHPPTLQRVTQGVPQSL